MHNKLSILGERLKSLPMPIFVFGSNEAGRHGKGAAKEAVEIWGAKYGIGRGLQGHSYAIPTKDKDLKVRSLEDIKKDVNKFLEFASKNPDKVFICTRIGCGLAGYKDSEIAPMFSNRTSNVQISIEWKDVLNEN